MDTGSSNNDVDVAETGFPNLMWIVNINALRRGAVSPLLVYESSFPIGTSTLTERYAPLSPVKVREVVAALDAVWSRFESKPKSYECTNTGKGLM